jgi:hypothetical protein
MGMAYGIKRPVEKTEGRRGNRGPQRRQRAAEETEGRRGDREP